MEPVDPQDLRISDADRHKVAELLREAAGEGRLDMDELDTRLDATYAAKTYGDLVPITLDLPTGDLLPEVRPAAAPARRSPPGVSPTYGASVAVMSETKRVGVWDVGERHTATAVMGSVVIDLREARFPEDEIVISACAVMGSVEVVVDARTAVVVDGYGVMGVFEESRSRVAVELDTASPVVRVRGLALMGSVEVKRKGPRGERWSRRVHGH